MSMKKLAFLATTALAGSLAVTAAHAQSTGSQTVEELVVTASTRAPTIDGTMIAETVAKTRSTITSEYIQTQAAGQSALQLINGVPGVNFTNNDPYGSSGGNIRIRSFDGNRISLLWDGMPLNDSGNYAIFSNQLLDAENIERIQVNVGTTDVDSPTASAAGGTINYITRLPRHDFGATMVLSVGSNDYNRVFAGFDTGEIGPWDTTAFFSVSRQRYDKFKGPGTLQKTQWNGRIYQPIGDNGDFVSVAFHYNVNRNNFYRNPSLAQWNAQHFDFEQSGTCVRPPPQNGSVQDESAGASADCTNYYNLRINPSNTGNIRVQSSFHLADNLRLTVDPSFQYVLANGGGTTLLKESIAGGSSSQNKLTAQLLGGSGLTAFDLNGDGDTLDVVRFYTPNTTNTRRYGVNASLIWDINDNNIIRLAYTADYANHRQTGEWTGLDGSGNPFNVFGGKDGHGPKVVGPDGSFMRQRDRYSKAILNQIAIDYNGKFFDGAVRVNIGVRAPYFERQLNNFCYTDSGGFGYCDTATPSAPLADGTVTLPNQPSSNHYLRPFHAVKHYHRLLPNLGVTWDVAEHHTLYASYAEGFSAPRTDNLYNFSIPNVQPETTKAVDVGWRYHSGSTLAQLAVWDTEFENRILTAFDPDLGISIDRNVGKVRLYGVDASVSAEPIENLTLYGSTSYIHSRFEDDLQVGRVLQGGVFYPAFLPTKGKELPETPHWTVFGRAQYRIAGFTAGLQGKYVGRRWATDVNDQATKSYTVWDADLRYDLGRLGLGKSWIQFNVINLFDARYLGGISSQTNFLAYTLPAVGTNPALTFSKSGSTPTFTVGAPRTYQLSLRAAF